MKKTIIRIIGFVLVLTLVLRYVDSVLSFKSSDGISQLSHFYDLEDNKVDVLFLGSSHAFVNFNNGTLYENYGIASYTLGGTVQPMWNSYYNLKEALKTQTPELIVLEGYGIVHDFEFSDDSIIIKNTYGMKWSKNKIEDIRTSVDPERKWDFWLTYRQYHNRYSSVEKGDFADDYGSQNLNYNWYGDSWKGQYLFMKGVEQSFMDVSNVEYTTGLCPKAEEYYRKIIELAQDNDIPIVVIVTPYELSEYEQGKYNRAKEIADEYGINFLNCNLLINEIGLDLMTQYADACHMTAEGAKVFSDYVGKYLKAKYEISDRRGDETYSSWQEQAKYVERYITDSKVANINDYDNLSIYLNDSNYWVMISFDGTCNTGNESMYTFCSQQGIPCDGSNTVCFKKNGDMIWCENEKYYSEKFLRGKYHDFCIKHDPYTNTNQMIIDNSPIKMVNNGVNIVIYDPDLNIVVDSVGINQDDNYSFVR